MFRQLFACCSPSPTTLSSGGGSDEEDEILFQTELGISRRSSLDSINESELESFADSCAMSAAHDSRHPSRPPSSVHDSRHPSRPTTASSHARPVSAASHRPLSIEHHIDIPLPAVDESVVLAVTSSTNLDSCRAQNGDAIAVDVAIESNSGSTSPQKSPKLPVRAGENLEVGQLVIKNAISPRPENKENKIAEVTINENGTRITHGKKIRDNISMKR